MPAAPGGQDFGCLNSGHPDGILRQLLLSGARSGVLANIKIASLGNPKCQPCWCGGTNRAGMIIFSLNWLIHKAGHFTADVPRGIEKHALHHVANKGALI